METASSRVAAIEFSLRIAPIVPVLFLGLLVRLFLATFDGFNIDIGAFRAWSGLLVDRGPWNFYTGGFFVDYAPGYLYVLMLFGGLNTIFQFSPEHFEYLLKLPAVAADLASAYLLYRLLEGQRPAVRLGSAAIYLLHPVVLFIGPVWGQVDSLLAFTLLLTVYYLAKGRLVAASLALVVGILVKPQAAAILPLFLFWTLRDYRPRALLQAAASAAGAGLILVLPFFPRNPFDLVGVMRDSAQVYPVNSFWAYNFWALFGTFKGGFLAMFKPDDAIFLGASHRDLGIFLFLLASLAIIYVFRRSKSPGELALATALATLAFYLFLTRMHERYLFPVFLPLLAASVLMRSRVLWAAFVGLTVLNFLNLYHVYTYYQYYFGHSNLTLDALSRLLQDWRIFLLALLTTLVFPLALAASYLLAQRKGVETPR